MLILSTGFTVGCEQFKFVIELLIVSPLAQNLQHRCQSHNVVKVMWDLSDLYTWLHLEPRSAVIGAIIGILATLYVQLTMFCQPPAGARGATNEPQLEADRSPWHRSHDWHQIEWWHREGHAPPSADRWLSQGQHSWKQWQHDSYEECGIDNPDSEKVPEYNDS